MSPQVRRSWKKNPSNCYNKNNAEKYGEKLNGGIKIKIETTLVGHFVPGKVSVI